LIITYNIQNLQRVNMKANYQRREVNKNVKKVKRFLVDENYEKEFEHFFRSCLGDPLSTGQLRELRTREDR
ncbi:hypothetical protein OAT93_01800, partial [bacterium]|nr:hypothetical protein [bacterium]